MPYCLCLDVVAAFPHSVSAVHKPLRNHSLIWLYEILIFKFSSDFKLCSISGALFGLTYGRKNDREIELSELLDITKAYNTDVCALGTELVHKRHKYQILLLNNYFILKCFRHLHLLNSV